MSERENAAERAFEAWAIAEGWSVTKRGWPDFLCYREGEAMAVEVKFSDNLSTQQRDACRLLSAHGIPTFIWSPPGPLDPFAEVEAPDAYALTIENDRLRTENELLRAAAADDHFRAAGLRETIAGLHRDLVYVLRQAEYIQHRPNRLREIMRRHSHLLRGVRPGLRSDAGRRRSESKSLRHSLLPSDEDAA